MHAALSGLGEISTTGLVNFKARTGVGDNRDFGRHQNLLSGEVFGEPSHQWSEELRERREGVALAPGGQHSFHLNPPR